MIYLQIIDTSHTRHYQCSSYMIRDGVITLYNAELVRMEYSNGLNAPVVPPAKKQRIILWPIPGTRLYHPEDEE